MILFFVNNRWFILMIKAVIILEQFHTNLIEDTIFQLLDKKLKEIKINNPEIVKLNSKKAKNKQALSRIMDKLSPQDWSALDDYLSTNNYLESLLLSDIYKSGFMDCIKLLKAVNII